MRTGSSQYSHTKEAEGRQEEGSEYKVSTHTVGDSLPPARRYLLTVPQPSQKATPAGDQNRVSKHMSL